MPGAGRSVAFVLRGDVVTPFGVALGQGQVGHEVVRGGAVPVPLVPGDIDDVAGTDPDDGSAAGLDQSFAFGDVERLGDRVRVPGGAGAGGEVHVAEGELVRFVPGRDWVDPGVAGEPF